MQPDSRRRGAASELPTSEDGPPGTVYSERAERFDRDAAARDHAVRLCGRLRLTVFTAAVAGVWWMVASGRPTAAWLYLAVSAALFAILVVWQRAARRRKRRAELMADFNREGIARVERRWKDLRPVPDLAGPGEHDYAVDLNLYGDVSLLHLAGVCGTGPGWATLRAWLLGRADPETVALRQEAVREMAGALDFRDRLAAEGRLSAVSAIGGGSDTPTERFLRWAEGDPWLPGHFWLRVASFVLPPVNLAAITLYSLDVVPTPALVWPLAVSALVLAPWRKAIHRVFAEADDGESGVRRYGPLLGHLRGAALESRYAAAIRERIGAGTHAAPEETSTLRRLLDMADVRRSPLFHIPLAVVLHWDVHVLAALERWKARSGSRVRDWVRTVGEAEALAALAALAADHPDWPMPVLDSGAPTLRAGGLGHPLLAAEACVRNDVEIGPAGSFLLVTGSNMSGKSTLLRAVGLNAVLAQAGGPVCAEELTMPPLRVVTSMRVEDSLADGVSYFMSGLKRLKQVVDAAEAAALPSQSAIDMVPPSEGASQSAIDSPPGPNPRTLYLLDEILQGTNSTERRIAARAVLRRLLDTGAIGAVTTHDLTLADADDLVARAVAVHFTESVDEGDEELTFDYRLREGIATSTNALRLLELVGLGHERKRRPASRC